MFDFKSNIFGLDEGYCDPYLCHSFIGTAVLGAGALGAGATIFGATTAANAQENVANEELANSQNQFNTTNNNLAPFRQIGTTAAGQLTSQLSNLTSPITMDESELAATPGYQFDLTQGLKATQNSAAARGLGSSGAALKGAATFATGLADNTQQTQFNIANTNQTNAFNRLSSLVNTGEGAAAGTGVINNAATAQENAALTQSGNAAAAGANSIGTAGTSLANLTGALGVASAKGGQGLFTSSPTTGSGATVIGPTNSIDNGVTGSSSTSVTF